MSREAEFKASREAASMRPREAASMTRAAALILLAGGFALGSVSTLGLLALFGELGHEYPEGETSARLERRTTAPSPRAPRAEEPLKETARRSPASPTQGPADLPRTDPAADIPAPSVSSYETLILRKPIVPVLGVDPASIQDTFNETRGTNRRHEATDIIAPRGAPVVAFDDGVVKKLFQSKQGGLTVYQFDRSETYCYYYAHLDGYAAGLQEGKFLRRGDRIGDVGTTGNAPAGTPHLHFAIFLLGPEKHWWQGTPINPFPVLVAVSNRPGAR